MTGIEKGDKVGEDAFKEIATAVSIMDTAGHILELYEELVRMKPYCANEDDVDRWNEFLHTTAISLAAIHLRASIMCSRLKTDLGAADEDEFNSMMMKCALTDPKVTAALFAVEDKVGVEHCMTLPPEVTEVFQDMCQAETLGLDTEDACNSLVDAAKEAVRSALKGEHPLPRGRKVEETEDGEYRIND